MTSYVEYDSNNSGGAWWLTDKHWKALERGGWKVKWEILDSAYTKNGDIVYEADGTPKLISMHDSNNMFKNLFMNGGRFLGALARQAYLPGATSIKEAVQSWEDITGLSALEAGCACCGQPHTFTLYQDGKMVDRGPTAKFEARWE